MLVPFVLCFLLADPAPAPTLQRIGRLDHPAIREASGIVASRKHPGVFWVHNDSGNPPALFAVRRDGTLIREFAVGVPNVDWEDIAVDDSGHLFVGEIGNNGSVLPLRAVYKLDEPDPFLEPKVDSDAKRPTKLNAVTACYYRFESGKRFDAEGLVIDKGRALLVAKTFDGRDAEVYAIPFDPPAPLLKPAVPERIGTLPGFTKPVTGASLSLDGKRLAVCSLRSVGVYERAGKDKWKRLAIRPFRSEDQIEAITWDGDDLILAGEERGVYRLPATAWRARASTPSQTP
jgi:hypothetical protein